MADAFYEKGSYLEALNFYQEVIQTVIQIPGGRSPKVYEALYHSFDQQSEIYMKPGFEDQYKSIEMRKMALILTTHTGKRDHFIQH